jgi:hypothetical protein
MSFNYHCEALSKKCNKMVGFICRATRDFKSEKSLMLLYKSLVLSQLEYAALVWSPQYKVHTDLLESNQRRFLRTVTLRFRRKRVLTSYANRLSFYRLKTLESRRKAQDFTFLYKIINGLMNTTLLSEIFIRVPNRSVRCERFFSVPSCNNNVSFHNPIYRMCRDYNSLLTRMDGVPDICGSSIHKWKTLVGNCLEK